MIGEGQVSHFEARQEPLAALRHQCGVVLSIASKNDPKNVHFEGGLLTEQDFVAPQIHWGPKVLANLNEVRAWHDSDEASVLVARVSDRFGDMGIVCAAVVERLVDRSEVRAFVLSCRVFGYGVETAMLSLITSIADEPIIGTYRPTKVNHLAKRMYLDHGFDADLGVEGRFLRCGPPLEMPAHARRTG